MAEKTPMMVSVEVLLPFFTMSMPAEKSNAKPIIDQSGLLIPRTTPIFAMVFQIVFSQFKNIFNIDGTGGC